MQTVADISAPEKLRAVLTAWRCEGALKDGRPCRKILMELDWRRPSFIRKRCERCATVNLWVEGESILCYDSP
jgi:phage FluMu protein Com